MYLTTASITPTLPLPVPKHPLQPSSPLPLPSPDPSLDTRPLPRPPTPSLVPDPRRSSLTSRLRRCRRNRVELLGAACHAGHTGCLRGAADTLQKWLDNPQHYIAPNLRTLVYKYGMQQISECRAQKAE